MEPKKYENRKVERRVPLHFLIGLNIALFLTLAAFEWKTEDGGFVVHDPGIIDNDWDTLLVIPPPPPPKPPPPPPKAIEIEVVKDDIPIDEPPKIEIDQNDNGPIEVINYEPDPGPETTDEYVYDIPPVSAEYPGGWNAFYTFMSKKLKYPSKARQFGIEGKVFVEFIIEKDGSISNMKVVKGMGYGCDEETLRVLKMTDRFIPAKKDSKAVRQKMILPIVFRLN